MGRPDFNSGEMRSARLVGSTPMSFRHHITLFNTLFNILYSNTLCSAIPPCQHPCPQVRVNNHTH